MTKAKIRIESEGKRVVLEIDGASETEINLITESAFRMFGVNAPKETIEYAPNVHIFPVQSEAAQESQERIKNNKFWETGIKYKDLHGMKDLPCYSTGYRCPQCNHDGKHYVADFSNYLSCHKCGQRIAVDKLGWNGEGDPIRGDDGNFFFAYRAWSENKEETQ